MKLPETYNKSIQVSGFTLIELLLVMALVMTVGVLTSTAGISYYQSQILNEATDNLASILRQAQGLAQSGTNNQAYGVYITDGSYIMFEGQDYTSRNTSEDLVFPISAAVTISGPGEITFSELTGVASVADTIYVSLGSKEKQIEILPSGYIDK